MSRRIALIALLLGLLAPAAQARQETTVASRIAVTLDGRAETLRSLADRAGGESADELLKVADRLDRALEGARSAGSEATLRVRLRFVLDDLAEVARSLDGADRTAVRGVRDAIEEALDELEEERRSAIAGNRNDAPEPEWSLRDEDLEHDRSDGRAREARARWREARNRFRERAPSFAGEFGDRWPYHETGVYPAGPAWRYNRVEGLVLGIDRAPLAWDSYDRLRVYGRGGYAFGMDEWRFTVGGEARLGRAYREERADLKVGASYRRDTATDDTWKLDPTENAVGAFFVRSDSYDWYDAEGWSAHAMARVSPYVQVGAVYRSEDHAGLANRARWSLFGGDDFRTNPAIDEGRMQSLTLVADGGLIRGWRAVPRGVAFRAEAEIGSGLGGDFDFSRFVGDVHAYTRTGPASGLAVRLRAGTSSGTLPRQKSFTLGGIGTVRGYPMNLLRGERMLLANAEYTLYGRDAFDGLFEDLSVFGLLDAGWTDGGTGRAFSMDDVAPSAGLGVGFGDRAMRLELAFPLRDLGTGMEPTLWLRLSPTL